MDALELLLTRHSQPKLIAPAPTGEALDNILKAAVKAPDHAGLKPWRFIVCEGEGLSKLGNIFEQAAISSEMSEKDIARACSLPKRAPMVIVAICEYKPHEKVPRVEQIASTACAVQSMQMAAMVQGFQGMWRTGSYATNNKVKEALSLKDEDEILGFLYLGTPQFACPARPEADFSSHVSYWR